MKIALKKSITDDVAQKFLQSHPALVGSIIGYDEIDTEDRYRIWDLCRADFGLPIREVEGG